MVDNPLKTHIWTSNEPREIKIDGKSISHHHCRKCGRDFAREASQADWKAVCIGAFSVSFCTIRWASSGFQSHAPGPVSDGADAVEETYGSASSVKVRQTKPLG